MTTFTNKLVAIVNKELESGVAMNSLAHMSLGLAGALGKNMLKLDNYIDGDGNVYPNISQMPYIILRGKSSEIRKAVLAARENNIEHTAFLDTMTGGTYLEQLERTKSRKETELVYYGCVLFGPWEKVSEITRKFSLWK
jgi:hypothetical protein